jgi:hypothetical protein
VHAYRGDAPADLLGARPAGSSAEHEAPVRTRPWSRQALRALCTAWLAIASSYRSDAPAHAHVGAADDGPVRAGGAES